MVLTISDGVAAGTRIDESGAQLAARLIELGFDCRQEVVADEMEAIAMAVARAADSAALVLTTGGTGLGPRDLTPQTLQSLLDYEIPGFGEVMRSAGRASTPLADLSRSLAGVLGRTLVVAVPGSRSGATESLAAIEPLLEHALDTLAGATEHYPPPDEGQRSNAADQRGSADHHGDDA
ncbi:MAG TPA: MogA/MoaB family molybdenum cofactor biosynthesis protein [Candidatus Limnocylindrales bacterium]|nr:MogA/MoaB family molybdenum cofactor biosynthesis protein [Candidatus Limnocylindrales bacterium]